MPGLTDTRPMTAPRHLPAEPSSTNESRQLLWIDGVGGFLLLTGQAVAIGGPTSTWPPGAITARVTVSTADRRAAVTASTTELDEAIPPSGCTSALAGGVFPPP